MEFIVSLLEQMTIWHWLGVGILLLCVEIMVGTFDLLWIAVAAFAAGLFGLVAPGEMGGWQGQLVFFGVAAVVLVIMGRTVFRGMRQVVATHPNLNDRMSTMVGQRGVAIRRFQQGAGKVRIGDTEWLAVMDSGPMVDPFEINAGDEVLVTGAQGTSLRVKPA